MLRGAPHPELARRFIDFVLSVDGQSLWQFKVSDAGLGPREFELRRLPIRREMYSKHFDQFVDKVDPWAIAKPVQNPNRAMRSFIAPLFQAMAIDQPFMLDAAWKKIIEHPAYPRDSITLVTADDVDDPQLMRMLELFDAMPVLPGPEGSTWDLADPEILSALMVGWLEGEWKDSEPELWPRESQPDQALRRDAREFFRSNYREIVRIGDGATG